MLYLAALVYFYVVNGHMRLIWPTPRYGADGTEGDGGLTTGPCGVDEYRIGDPDDNDNITELEPGINTIVIETIVNHANYQYRIALANPSGNTDEDDEYDECILVDHVPQYTTGNVESVHINVSIPNVDCDECGLQVTMLQSNGPCCNRYDADCIGTIYHSCATVKINGKKSWSKRECEQPCVWGWRDYPENHYGGAEDNSYWTLSGTELWLDYTANYMAPNETCCETALGNKGCDDTEDDTCKWFDSDSNSGKSNSNSGYSSSEKKTGEQAGIAIFVILVLAIGGTIGYTYFFKKKPLDQDNGALIMSTTTKTGQVRSQTIGSIQNNIVRDHTNYVTSGENETADVKPMPVGVPPPTTTGYTQPPVPPPRKEEPVYQQEQQTYQPQEYQQQEYQQQEYQQQSNDYQPQEYQTQEPPQQYEEPPQQYDEPPQQYEEPQHDEPEVEIPEMDQYGSPPDQYDENQYQNDENPTDGYDM